MEFKGKEEQHVTFAKGFKSFLIELQKYVKSHHTTGLAWNPCGGVCACVCAERCTSSPFVHIIALCGARAHPLPLHSAGARRGGKEKERDRKREKKRQIVCYAM